MESAFAFLGKESNGRFDAGEMAHLAKLTEYGFTVGFILGGFVAGRQALLQFKAEHQHVLPAIKRRAEVVMLVRNQNYRVMAAFGVGGITRGVQIGSICILYGFSKMASARWRRSLAASEGRMHPGQWVDDVLAGAVAGSSFAFAGKGQRLYYLGRGSLYGLALGGLLAALRAINQSFEEGGLQAPTN